MNRKTRFLGAIVASVGFISVGSVSGQVPRAFTDQQLRVREQALLDDFRQARFELREVRERLNPNLLPFLSPERVAAFQAEAAAKLENAQRLRNTIIDIRRQLADRQALAQRAAQAATASAARPARPTPLVNSPVRPPRPVQVAISPPARQPQPPVPPAPPGGISRGANQIGINRFTLSPRNNIGVIPTPSAVGTGAAAAGKGLSGAKMNLPGKQPGRSFAGSLPAFGGIKSRDGAPLAKNPTKIGK